MQKTCSSAGWFPFDQHTLPPCTPCLRGKKHRLQLRTANHLSNFSRYGRSPLKALKVPSRSQLLSTQFVDAFLSAAQVHVVAEVGNVEQMVFDELHVSMPVRFDFKPPPKMYLV